VGVFRTQVCQQVHGSYTSLVGPFVCKIHDVWLQTHPVHCKVSLQSLGFYDTLIMFVYNSNNNNNNFSLLYFAVFSHCVSWQLMAGDEKIRMML